MIFLCHRFDNKGRRRKRGNMQRKKEKEKKKKKNLKSSVYQKTERLWGLDMKVEEGVV